MADLLDSISPTAKGYVYFALLIIIGEIFFYLAFEAILRQFNLLKTGNKAREIFKGVLERVMLAIGIAHGITTVIVAFGVLKVATKLSLSAADHERRDEVQSHNDYFLVGNLMSLVFGIIYALVAIKLKFVVWPA